MALSSGESVSISASTSVGPASGVADEWRESETEDTVSVVLSVRVVLMGEAVSLAVLVLVCDIIDSLGGIVSDCEPPIVFPDLSLLGPASLLAVAL